MSAFFATDIITQVSEPTQFGIKPSESRPPRLPGRIA